MADQHFCKIGLKCCSNVVLLSELLGASSLSCICPLVDWWQFEDKTWSSTASRAQGLLSARGGGTGLQGYSGGPPQFCSVVSCLVPMEYPELEALLLHSVVKTSQRRQPACMLPSSLFGREPSLSSLSQQTQGNLHNCDAVEGRFCFQVWSWGRLALLLV